MALIKCAECGHDVSTAAASCPNCGAPGPKSRMPAPAAQAGASSPPKRMRWWQGALMVIGGTIAVVVFMAVWQQHEPEIASSYAKASPPSLSVSADELQAAYSQNTVAADNRFKGTRLAVSGTVASINTDLADNVIVALQAANEFNNPQAELAGSERQAAAQLHVGDQVRLVCVGNGDIVKTPMLKGCTF